MTEADLVAWFKQWTRAELEAALGELARGSCPYLIFNFFRRKVGMSRS